MGRPPKPRGTTHIPLNITLGPTTLELLNVLASAAELTRSKYIDHLITVAAHQAGLLPEAMEIKVLKSKSAAPKLKINQWDRCAPTYNSCSNPKAG